MFNKWMRKMKSQGTNKFTAINLTIFVQCLAKIIT